MTMPSSELKFQNMVYRVSLHTAYTRIGAINTKPL